MRARAWATRVVLAAAVGWGGSPALAVDRHEGGLEQHFVGGAVAGGGVIDEIQRRDLVKVGVSMFEPWAMCDTEGDLIGFEIDVAEKLADDMGVRILFVRTDWYYIIPALIEREFDVIVSGMSITPQRNLHVNFTAPYAESGSAIVANAERTEDWSEPRRFDAAEVRFAVQRGTVQQEVVEKHFPSAEVVFFDTGAEVLQALVDGDAHAVSASLVTATQWLVDHPDALRRPFERLYNKLPEAMALRKGDADGLNFFDSWIVRHQVNGWLDERRRYWFETRDWADRVAEDGDVVAECAESFAPNPY